MFKKSFIIVSVMALSMFFLLISGCAPEALTESAIDDQIDDALNGYLKPIAYGFLTDTGSVYNGSGNFTFTDNSIGNYAITITGVTLTNSNFAFTTAYGTGTEVAKWSVTGGNLIIEIFNDIGAPTDSYFSFVLY